MIYYFKATAKMSDIEPSKVGANLDYVSCLSKAEILGVISHFKEKSNETGYDSEVYINDVAELLGEYGDIKTKTTAILLSLMCCGYIEPFNEE